MAASGRKRIVVGITGASGVLYGIRTLEILRDHPDYEVHLVMTAAAKLNVSIETALDIATVEGMADVVHGYKDISAAISSGSFRTEGMIVAPCSMRTLSAIVNSFADNLLVRAADVTLKEYRRLVLLPREAPLHAGHCRLLHQAAQMGAVIFPPVPAFYTRPRTIEDIVNNTVGRVLDLFGIDTGLVTRWEGPGDHPND
jgi:4-hydroxy-3-polyprenylbenzoate decarboxylase